MLITGEIEPGIRIGNFRIGTKKEDILSEIDDRYTVWEREDGFSIYTFDNYMLWFEADGKLQQIMRESKIMLIKELYENISEIQGESLAPLELWYNEMINKRIDELSILDISRMLRQNELMPLAVSKAMERLIKNPLDGEMYDGNLLYQVVDAIKMHGASVDKQTAEEFIKIANARKETYDWEFAEEKAEYDELLDTFKRLIS